MLFPIASPKPRCSKTVSWAYNLEETLVYERDEPKILSENEVLRAIFALRDDAEAGASSRKLARCLSESFTDIVLVRSGTSINGFDVEKESKRVYASALRLLKAIEYI